MLVPFVIDADSLAPDPAWLPAHVRTCHEGLIDTWQRIGLLEYDSHDFETSRLKSAIDKLPQKIRPLWMEMVERLPLRACRKGWNGSVIASSVGALSNHASVALVDDARAEVEFGMSEYDLTIRAANAPDVEVCRLQSASQAASFKKAIAKSGAYIEVGDKFSDIWALRFQLLAGIPIKRVSIVDRYAMSRHVTCPQTQLSGLERFLRLLDADACGPRHVTLYSGWTEELKGRLLPDVEEEIRQLLGKLPRKKVGRIKVVMLPNSTFSGVSHDRFVRFENHVWEIGIGLQVFEGAFASERSTATFKTGEVVTGFKRVEDELRAHAAAKEAVITT